MFQVFVRFDQVYQSPTHDYYFDVSLRSFTRGVFDPTPMETTPCLAPSQTPRSPHLPRDSVTLQE